MALKNSLNRVLVVWTDLPFYHLNRYVFVIPFVELYLFQVLSTKQYSQACITPPKWRIFLKPKQLSSLTQLKSVSVTNLSGKDLHWRVFFSGKKSEYYVNCYNNKHAEKIEILQYPINVHKLICLTDLSFMLKIPLNTKSVKNFF